MTITITAIYAGLLGLWFAVLSARVILQRRGSAISLGFKDDRQLERRIRAHGNFAEYAPIALILIVCLELQGAASWLLHLLGALLLIGRLLHGYALSFTTYSPLRVPGMGMTLLCVIIASAANLVMALS